MRHQYILNENKTYNCNWKSFCAICLMCPHCIHELEKADVGLATSLEWVHTDQEGCIPRPGAVKGWSLPSSAPAVPQQALDWTQGLSKLCSQASYNIHSKVIFRVSWKSVLVLSDACRFHTFLQKISSCFQISWSYSSQQKQLFVLVKTKVILPTLYNL